MNAQPQPKQDQPTQAQRKAVADDSMGNRVVKLETRWDAVIPNLATKADISDLRGDLAERIARSESKTTDAVAALRVEMKDGNASLLRWVVGTMLAGLCGVVGIMALLFSVMVSKPVASVPAHHAPISQPDQPTTHESGQ